MRLIDVDELTEKCGEWYTEEGTEEGFIGTLKGLLDAAPTIAAIPVEWLRKKREVAIWQFAGAIDWLLSEWQEEQEART